jgi:hypothetical protein
MGHLYHGYVSHNQRVNGLFGIRDLEKIVNHWVWYVFTKSPKKPSQPPFFIGKMMIIHDNPLEFTGKMMI